MNKIKSNPYVYPYVPFYDLSDKKYRATFTDGDFLNLNQIKKILNFLENPKIILKGKTYEEKILSIFVNKNVLFGPKNFILHDKKKWLDAIKYFTDKKRPVLFSILGFPFKIPVSLKTDRTVPDMGEVLMLRKLYTIGESVSKVYPHGVKINVFTEGVFGKFNSTPEAEFKNYYKALKKINKSLKFDKYIQIIELEEMEKLSVNFDALFEKKLTQIKHLLKTREKNIVKKFKGIDDSLKRIVNSKKYNLEERELMDIYNPSLKDKDLPKYLQNIRKNINKNIKVLGINYLAYLSVRDDLDFLNKKLPGVLTLSVSPKPGRLGVLPIDKHCVRLAYHGVPVYHPGKKRFSIEYLIDLKRKSGTYKKVFFKDFPESTKPFYYIKTK